MSRRSKAPKNDALEKIKEHRRRVVAQEKQHKRRCQTALYFRELVCFLPFDKEATSQMDYSSLLQLTIAYLKMKAIIGNKKAIALPNKDSSNHIASSSEHGMEACEVSSHGKSLPSLHSALVKQTMDGFLIVIDKGGTVLFVSDSVKKYLGFLQTHLISKHVYGIIAEDDQNEVSEALNDGQLNAVASTSGESVRCSFFCRMKCQQKVCGTACYSASDGYRLVYVSGQCKVVDEEPRLVAMVTPVSTPSILEIAVDGNLFITHYSLDMRCTFYDGRLHDLIGFGKADMVKSLLFDRHHHDDILMCQKCAEGVFEKGEGISGYYRFVAKSGVLIWLQTRAVLVCDSLSGKPQSLMCFNFVISKEEAEKFIPIPALTDSSSLSDNSVTTDDSISILSPGDSLVCSTTGTVSPSSLSNSISDTSSICLSLIRSSESSDCVSAQVSAVRKSQHVKSCDNLHHYHPFPVTTKDWRHRNPLRISSASYSLPLSPPLLDQVCSLTTSISHTSILSLPQAKEVSSLLENTTMQDLPAHDIFLHHSPNNVTMCQDSSLSNPRNLSPQCDSICHDSRQSDIVTQSSPQNSSTSVSLQNEAMYSSLLTDSTYLSPADECMSQHSPQTDARNLSPQSYSNSRIFSPKGNSRPMYSQGSPSVPNKHQNSPQNDTMYEASLRNDTLYQASPQNDAINPSLHIVAMHHQPLPQNSTKNRSPCIDSTCQPMHPTGIRNHSYQNHSMCISQLSDTMYPSRHLTMYPLSTNVAMQHSPSNSGVPSASLDHAMCSYVQNVSPSIRHNTVSTSQQTINHLPPPLDAFGDACKTCLQKRN
uniref:Hypoxia-inducible factor 1-alpha-like protein n=1 Tax=Halisarca dujardinii TaxID=2583056 RepID=A0A6C0PMZ9_HALDU|nr:hypoxia-inducible factor 1-alpha-like protein [Halisarca dujardinii]